MKYDEEIRIILEKEIISSLLNNSELFFTKKHALSIDNFSDTSHKIIYSAINKSVNNFKTVSLSTVRESITDVSKGDLSTNDVISLMSNYKPLKGELFNKHCELLFEYNTCDKLTEIGNQIINSNKNNLNNFQESLNLWKAEISSLGVNVEFEVSLQESIDNTIALILEKVNSKEVILGVSSGTYEINEFTSGWTQPDLIILAGRPGMGKSAFAIHCCKENVFNNDPAAFFSYEMPSQQILERIAGSMVKIDTKQIKNGKINREQFTLVSNALNTVKRKPLYIIDKPLALSHLINYIRYLKFKKDIKVAYIDYVQLIPNDFYKGNSEDLRIGGISSRLKLLALELKIPIVLLSQLSRAVESRAGVKKPNLSDLRGSGSLEQDADIVGFFYRPEYYNTNMKGYLNNGKNLCLFIISKGRSIGTNEFDLFYKLKFNYFEDWENNYTNNITSKYDDDDDEPF